MVNPIKNNEIILYDNIDQLKFVLQNYIEEPKIIFVEPEQKKLIDYSNYPDITLLINREINLATIPVSESYYFIPKLFFNLKILYPIGVNLELKSVLSHYHSIISEPNYVFYYAHNQETNDYVLAGKFISYFNLSITFDLNLIRYYFHNTKDDNVQLIIFENSPLLKVNFCANNFFNRPAEIILFKNDDVFFNFDEYL